MHRLPAVVTAILFMAGSAFAGECPTHEVRLGDTLSKLAETHLGDKERAAEIYERNIEAIGSDPGLIEVGMVLVLPCEETSEVVVVANNEPAPPPPPEPLPHLHILTGGPFAPFAGRDLAEGGLTTELLRAALAAWDEAPDYTIGFVNDRAAHLDVILPRGGFAISYPWVYPECAKTPLTRAQTMLCEDYRPSAPLFEYVIEVYTRADGRFAEAQFLLDLSQATICRPLGYPLDDLMTSGLLPDRVTIVRGADPADCMARLDAGTVDIASMDARVTRALVGRMELANPILVLEALTRIETMHAIVPANHPEAARILQVLNAGLDAIDANGSWLTITDRHLNPPLN